MIIRRNSVDLKDKDKEEVKTEEKAVEKKKSFSDRIRGSRVFFFFKKNIKPIVILLVLVIVAIHAFQVY